MGDAQRSGHDGVGAGQAVSVTERKTRSTGPLRFRITVPTDDVNGGLERSVAGWRERVENRLRRGDVEPSTEHEQELQRTHISSESTYMTVALGPVSKLGRVESPQL